MAKKKEKIEGTEIETILDVVEEVADQTTSEKIEAINEVINQKLEDLDGIGPIRLKKLYGNGIYTIDDLLSHGEESLSRMLDISWDDAKKMTMIANESINTDDVFSNLIVSGKEYFNYRKNKIKYMSTGLAEFDDITGGYETGVITEFFGAFGSGKTQFMMVAAIMVQMPKDPCCLDCDMMLTIEDKKCTKCEGERLWSGGGLSEIGKPCRVIYIDTENSYRPERLFQIVCNRGLVLTKPQTKNEEKKQANKEPLNDEEYEKAMEFVYNIDISRPRTSALQMLVVSNLSSMIAGELCKICHKREISKEGLPTHQNHAKAKKDMELANHDFEFDKVARMVIMDSLTGKFRKEYEGRGTLSDRQMKLKSHVKLLEGVVEGKNVICLVTNQVGEKMDLAGAHADNIRPVGGNEIGHIFTHRIYLKKAQSLTKDKITAILVDSPNHAKNEVALELGYKGIQKLAE